MGRSVSNVPNLHSSASLQAGIEHFRCGHYQEATRAIKAVLRSSPENTVAKQYLADLQDIHTALKEAIAKYDSGDYQDCLRAIKRVQKRNPDDPSANEMASKVSELLRNKSGLHQKKAIIASARSESEPVAAFRAPVVPVDKKNKSRSTAWTIVLCVVLLAASAGIGISSRLYGVDEKAQRPSQRNYHIVPALAVAPKQPEKEAGQQAMEFAREGNHAGALMMLEEARRDADPAAIAALAELEVLVRLEIAEQLISSGNSQGAKLALTRVLLLSPGHSRGTVLMESLNKPPQVPDLQATLAPVAAENTEKGVSRKTSKTRTDSQRRARSKRYGASKPSQESPPTAKEKVAPETPPTPILSSLSIATRPSASILVNGQSLGTTPVVERQITPGTHVISLAAKGYVSMTKTISVVSNQHIDLAIDLVPVPKPKPETPKALPTPVSVSPEPARTVPKAGYYLIAHPGSKARSLSVPQLRNIFLGSKRYWSSGKRIVPLLRPGTTSAGRRFFDRVVKMNTTSFHQHWDRLELAGEAIAPKTVVGAARLARIVSKRSGAVSFISAGELDKVENHNLLIIPASF